MAMHIAPRIGRHAAGATKWRLDRGAVKANPARGQLVDIGGVQMGMPVATEIIPPQLVEHYEENIFRFPHGARPFVSEMSKTA